MYSTSSNKETKNLLVDEPIVSAKQDRLNRDQFAKHFAETLLGHLDPSCLIAALYGHWGSGKSSLLNLIENHLCDKSSTDNFIVIKFNPWNISSVDQVIAMFFHEIKVAIIGNKPTKQLKNKTIKLLDILSGILTVGQLSPIGSQYFAFGASLTRQLKSTLKDTKDKPLAELKKDLDGLLLKNAKRIFILIDDIDRLDHNAMRLLFRMIRLNADFKNTTYLLAFDNNLVEDLLDLEQPKHGKEYLEKIIQLPVDIPHVDEAILIEILTQALDNFISKYDESKFDTRLWQDLVTEGRFFKLFRTIRDIVRYLNGLRVNSKLVLNEVNLVDFMALEAIRIFAAESYEFIRRNKALFTRLRTRGPLEQDENVEQTREILDRAFIPSHEGPAESRRRGEIIKDICRVMFPQLGRIYANMSYDSSSEQLWRKRKRICSEDVFDKYFILGIPKGEISDGEMLSVLARSSNSLSFQESINELFDRKLGRRFLELTEDYIDRVNPPDIEEVIVALFNIEEKVISEPRAILQADAELLTSRLIYLLLKQIDDTARRKQIITHAIGRTSRIYLPVYFISMITPDKTGERSRNEALQELGFSNEDLHGLQELCVSILRKYDKSKELSKLPHLGMLLFRWLDWGDKAEVKRYVKKLTESDEGTLDLLVGFSTEVLSTSGRYRRIDKNNISKFVKLALIEERAKRIKETQWSKLNKLQKEALEAFFRKEDLP